MIPRHLWTRTLPVRGLRRVRVLDASVAAMIVVVLCALALVSGRGVDPEPDRAALERSSVRVAEQQALDLTTLDRKSIDTAGPALTARTAAAYRTDFAALLTTWTRTAMSYDGLAEGRVVSSRLVSLGERTAEVRVVAATTTTKRQAEPLVRRWTAAVTLTLDDSDHWLVSGLALR